MVLLYGRAARLTAKNGGFRPGQWEYSPAYALRSYLFLLPHSAAVSALHAASGSKVVAFYGARKSTLPDVPFCTPNWPVIYHKLAPEPTRKPPLFLLDASILRASL